MRGLSSSLRRRWDAVYHRASIQMILSLSFTAVAVVGMVFLGCRCFCVSPPPTTPFWRRTASVCCPR